MNASTRPALPAPLILASTSRYRHALLQRLALPFHAVDPAVDESALADETPAALAQRLALAKAQAVAQRHPQAIIIGSDQVANLGGQALGKPGDHDRARAQLRAMSGKTLVFHTALAVLRPSVGLVLRELADVHVQVRQLNDGEIERYLLAERPYDCAGAAKSEGLGIALLARIDSDDPSALVGLPLIRTCALLRQAGCAIP